MSTTATDFPTRPTFPPNPSFSFTGPPPSPPSPTNGFSSIFQSPGGPPLILVCIAAGLLLGAFIGVLLMRRMRPPPVGQRGIGAAAFLAGANQPLGEKPKLLDIHLSPAHTTAGIDEGAEHGTGKEKLGEQGAWGAVSVSTSPIPTLLYSPPRRSHHIIIPCAAPPRKSMSIRHWASGQPAAHICMY